FAAFSTRTGEPPVAPFDDRRIQPDDVHIVAETELFLQQATGDSQLGEFECRIEEQFHRVVARLAMNVYRARVIRSEPVVQPEIVGEPSLRRGDGHQFSRALVVDSEFRLPLPIEYAFDTWRLTE